MTVSHRSGRRQEVPEEVLSLEGISLWLSGREILHDVSFSLRAGELTGLIGSNGAGKTTIFRVILGLQAPISGQGALLAASRALGAIGSSATCRRSSRWTQTCPLRARDLVALGLDGDRFGLPLPSRGRRQTVDDMLEAVDAQAFADARSATSREANCSAP